MGTQDNLNPSKQGTIPINESALESLLAEIDKGDFSALKNNKKEFNIFKILKVENYEVRMHSMFLAELLDPKGSHGMGDLFLASFIKNIQSIYTETEKIKNLAQFETTSAKVFVEYGIGNINSDYTEGGRIDILISSEDKDIVIENKIYACDQHKQLIRYHNYILNKKREAILFYLTLDGCEAGKESVTGNDIKLEACKDYFPISYKKDILNWLEGFTGDQILHEYPALKGTISQYIDSIKYLTNQTMCDIQVTQMSKMIADNPQYIKAARMMVEHWDSVKLKMVENLYIEIERTFKPCGWNIKAKDKLGQKGTGFWFWKESWKAYVIYFYFNTDFNDVEVGIHVFDKPDDLKTPYVANPQNDLTPTIETAFSELGQNIGNGWIWGKKFPEWDKYSWENIKQVIPEIEKEITDYSKILDQIFETN